MPTAELVYDMCKMAWVVFGPDMCVLQYIPFIHSLVYSIQAHALPKILL